MLTEINDTLPPEAVEDLARRHARRVASGDPLAQDTPPPCLPRRGPPLTIEQIDQVIHASVMEELMRSMGWDPASVVSAEDWPPLDDIPDEEWDPFARQFAQMMRDKKVKFFVPNIDFCKSVDGNATTGERDEDIGTFPAILPFQ